MKSDHFSVGEGTMKYYYYDTYYALCESYGTQADTSAIKDQALNTVLKETEKILVLCEAARAANVTLDDSDLKIIEDNIELIKKTASDKNMSISQFFGDCGVTEEDIRYGDKLISLSQKYRSIKYTEFYGKLPSAEKLLEYYKGKLGAGVTIGESYSRNIGILILESESVAESALEDLRKTPMKKKDFEDFVDTYINTGAAEQGGYYENTKRNQYISEINDWLFSTTLMPGDCAIIKVDVGFALCFYGGLGEVTWKLDASSMYASEELDKWFATLQYTVSTDKEVLDSIK